MYICICNAIRESELRSAARERHVDVEMLYRELGHRPQCGQCLSYAETILAQERGALDMSSMLPG